MFKLIHCMLIGAALCLTLGCGGGDPDAKFRPPKGEEPQAPETVGRTGSSESFLPSEGPDGG